MKILDKVVQKLVLRWLRGKAERLRKEGSAVMKILDGNKRLLFVLAFVAVQLLSLVTGTDYSGMVDSVIKSTGLADPDVAGWARGIAVFLAPLLLAAWAALHALWKGYKQIKAGATLTEVNSLEGYVKQARAEGKL
jgi:hypothetical protein